MDFTTAKFQMLSWRPDLPEHVRSENELTAAYQAARWVKFSRPEPDPAKGWLKGRGPAWHGLASIGTNATGDKPVRERQVYAIDLAAADMVIDTMERRAGIDIDVAIALVLDRSQTADDSLVKAYRAAISMCDDRQCRDVHRTSARLVVEHFEAALDKIDLEILLRLGSGESTWAVSRKVGLSQKAIRNHRDRAIRAVSGLRLAA